MGDRAPKRKPNWTDTEQIIMLDLYAKYKEVLASRENTILNCHEKSKCWVQITQQLNQINPSIQRSVEEVKRKWHNLLGQGRRDYFDWKRARQDPKLPAVNMPTISRRALELHGGFRFEDREDETHQASIEKSIQDDEFVYIDAGDPVMSEDRAADDHASPDVLPETIAPVNDTVKQECPSPLDESCRGATSLTSVVANATPPPHSKSPPSSTLHAQRNHPPLTPPNPPHQMPPPPESLHIVQSATSLASGDRIRVSTVSPRLNFSPQTSSTQRFVPPVSASLIHQTLTSLSQTPVTMATATHISSSMVNPSSVLESSSLLSRVPSHPHPLEPARKKFRESRSGQLERGVGLNSDREAELRIDILQLEKDKLWLETEKLRLEIDILRKQKEQMNNSF